MNQEEEYVASWEKRKEQQFVPKAVQQNEAMQKAVEFLRLKNQLGIELLFYDKDLKRISGKYGNMADLLKNPEFISRLTQELYISDKDETTWFKLKLKNGKLVSMAYVMTFKLNWITIYNKRYSGFDVLVVGYSPGIGNVPAKTTAVPRSKFTPEQILGCFLELKGQTACDSKEIGKLLLYIISKKVVVPSPDSLEYVGNKQGFVKNTDLKIRFSPPHLLREEIYDFIPKSVTCRQYPAICDWDTKDLTPVLMPLFSGQIVFQLLLLFRLASWHQSFFAKKGIYADNILIIKPTKNIPFNIFVALVKNTRYDSLDAPPIGPNIQPLKNELESVNDGMVVAIDVYAADEVKKAEKGYDLLINDASGAGGNDTAVYHITTLISEYADMYFPKNKCCVLEHIDDIDVSTCYSAAAYNTALNRLDGHLVLKTETGCNKGDFIKIFNGHIDEIQKNIPNTIPPSKHNIYIMLITALRMYNEWYSPLFSPNIEQYIEEWLCSQEQEKQPLYDIICSEYGKILNKKITDGYFSLIPKEEVTPFDKGSHTIVVDKDKRRIYIETADNFAIAKNEMPSVADTDSLTEALYSCEYLPHNAKNEKSVRIAAITSDGTPYPLYVHAISYKLLTQENRQRFELIDKDTFLFKYDEIPEGLLPLVKTIDGRFAGKMLRYEAEENNVYFGTGRIGSGKSWAIAQIICMLFMLGHTVVVFDVSGSYTKEKLLKMLPAEAVEKLFKFINVGAGKNPIPIDLGSLRGCETLPDKKRAIYSVLRAATGPLDKSEVRKLKGFLSDYLKNKEYSVSLQALCSELGQVGSFGTEIADCVQSVLDDIKEVGFEEQTWDDLFLQESKIIVINLGNEVGESTHQLLDMMVGSLFNWQMSHDAGFLSIAIDELADQDFSPGAPLHTTVKQGRKFHTALIGATQDYYNQGSSHLDTMKQANMKGFCRPGKSEDRIAQKLGYSNATDAGFNKFKAGDTILELDAYNKETGENEALTLKGKVVNFVETPLYEKFKELYGVF